MSIGPINSNVPATNQAQELGIASETSNQQSQNETVIGIQTETAAEYAAQISALQTSDATVPAPTYDSIQDFIEQMDIEIITLEFKLQMLDTLLSRLADVMDQFDPAGQAEAQQLLLLGEQIRNQMTRDIAGKRAHVEHVVTYGSDIDFDGDGITNEEEANLGSDAWNWDTDGDGLADGIELIGNWAGHNMDLLNHDTDGDGIHDGYEWANEAANIANETGLPNYAPLNTSDHPAEVPGGGDGDGNVDGAGDGDGDPAPAGGPTPDSDAEVVTLSAQSVVNTQAALATASTNQSVLAMQSSGSDPETAEELFELLTDPNLDNGQPKPETIIEAEWSDMNADSYTDVIIDIGDHENVAVVQEGDDLIVYTDEAVITIREGANRRVFFTSDSDNVMNNIVMRVDLQTWLGATGYRGGEAQWVSGIFVEGAQSQTYGAASNVAENTGYSFNPPSGNSGNNPAPTTVTTGIEGVFLIENVFTDDTGRLERNAANDDIVMEQGNQFKVEYYTMTGTGNPPIIMEFPATVGGVLVQDIVAYEDGNDVVYELKASNGDILKRIVVENQVIYGNTADNGTQIHFRIPNGPVDPLNGSYSGGDWIRADFSEITSNYVHVIGGNRDSDITLSNYTHSNASQTFDYFQGGAGNDYVQAGAHGATIHGGDGHDWLMGSGGNDVITGGRGKDAIDAGLGNNTLDGGTGDDILLVGDPHGTNTIIGGIGHDVTNAVNANDDVESTIMDETRSDATNAFFGLLGQVLGSDTSIDLEALLDEFNLIMEDLEENMIADLSQEMRALLHSTFEQLRASLRGEDGGLGFLDEGDDDITDGTNDGDGA